MQWDPGARRALLVSGGALAAIGLCVTALAGWGSSRPPARGLLDGMASPALHGLPIPRRFEIVATTELPHDFGNEPVVPQAARIVVRLRTPRPVDAVGVLRAVEQRLVQSWGCASACARLDVPGYADAASCQRNHDPGGVSVEYRAADWDAAMWRRRLTREVTVTVATPVRED